MLMLKTITGAAAYWKHLKMHGCVSLPSEQKSLSKLHEAKNLRLIPLLTIRLPDISSTEAMQTLKRPRNQSLSCHVHSGTAGNTHDVATVQHGDRFPFGIGWYDASKVWQSSSAPGLPPVPGLCRAVALSRPRPVPGVGPECCRARAAGIGIEDALKGFSQRPLIEFDCDNYRT
jgi:hypothetical protein